MQATPIVHEHQHVEAALDATPKAEPDETEKALEGLRAAVRQQIIALASGEITSKSLAQLQRICGSFGQAMVTLEKPDALVRSRFKTGSPYAMLNNGGYSMGEYLEEDDALSPAPASETYGANASRGIIESAAKIGKDIVAAQAEAQKKAREPTLTEMISALAQAKNAKLSKSVIKIMEKQIEEASKKPVSALALPAAIPPDPPKTHSRRRT